MFQGTCLLSCHRNECFQTWQSWQRSSYNFIYVLVLHGASQHLRTLRWRFRHLSVTRSAPQFPGLQAEEDFLHTESMSSFHLVDSHGWPRVMSSPNPILRVAPSICCLSRRHTPGSWQVLAFEKTERSWGLTGEVGGIRKTIWLDRLDYIMYA